MWQSLFNCKNWSDFQKYYGPTSGVDKLRSKDHPRYTNETGLVSVLENIICILGNWSASYFLPPFHRGYLYYFYSPKSDPLWRPISFPTPSKGLLWASLFSGLDSKAECLQSHFLSVSLSLLFSCCRSMLLPQSLYTFCFLTLSFVLVTLSFLFRYKRRCRLSTNAFSGNLSQVVLLPGLHNYLNTIGLLTFTTI